MGILATPVLGDFVARVTGLDLSKSLDEHMGRLLTRSKSVPDAQTS